jgi:hypothetical protein
MSKIKQLVSEDVDMFDETEMTIAKTYGVGANVWNG